MLQVQEYLRNGKTLEDLKTEFGIKHNAKDGLVVLNYDQIDSPKTHPIVMECRSLILEEGTWEVASWAFRRFFNHGEALDVVPEYNLKDFHVLEKVDGSLIQHFHYNDEWRMATRGTVDGTGQVGFLNKTFRDLFEETASQYPEFWRASRLHYTYIFELVSPENRVVKNYADKELYLLAVRDFSQGGIELPYEAVVEEAERLGVKYPKLYESSDIEGLMKLTNDLETLDEGFVCVHYGEKHNDIHYRRVKVKNPAYVAIAHLKESAASSMRGLMQLVMVGEEGEFLSYFPEYEKHIKVIKARYDEYVADINADFDSVRDLLSLEKTPENRKVFALRVKDMKNSAFMFQLYNGKVTDYADWLNKLMASKGAKNTAKMILAHLNLKDKDFE
jgi:hypothetical protein